MERSLVQSPRVEATKPMVLTTTVFLLLIVVLTNVGAMAVRSHLRERYETGAFWGTEAC